MVINFDKPLMLSKQSRKICQLLYRLGIASRSAIYKIVRYSMPTGYCLLRIKSTHSEYVFYTHYEGLQVIDEILLLGAYRKSLESRPKVVIDLGAHIGVFTVLVADKILRDYSEGIIVSIEPISLNYKLLLNNIKINNISKVVYPIKCAISDNKEYLELEWIGIKERVQTKTIFDVLDIVKKYGYNQIDLLKIDIEGAELKLLTNNNKWLKNVRNIVMEIHPWVYGYRGIDIIFKELKKHEFTVHIIVSKVDSKYAFKAWMNNVQMSPQSFIISLWKSITTMGLNYNSILYVLALKSPQ